MNKADGNKLMPIMRRLVGEPVRVAMLAMAAALVALAVFFTSSAKADVGLNVVALAAISTVLFYVLPALFVEDVGKLHMDAATAASVALAAASLMEAYLLIATDWGPLVMVAASLPPLVAGLIVSHIHYKFNALAVDSAVFGFLVLMMAILSADFVEHSTIYPLLTILIVISNLSYIFLLIDGETCGP
jgi:hypothetical protein